MSGVKCGQHFVVLRKKINSTFLFAFFPILCKSWNCEKCRSIKGAIVRNYIKEHFQGRELWMLTFTLFHTGNPDASWKRISSAWNRFRLAATRKHGKFSYIRILEPHKKGGFPHMHVLVDRPVADQSLVRKITKFGFGWNFESQRISLTSALGYVSKYLTKGWENLNADYLRRLTKARIVSVSRDLPAVFYKEASWELLKNTVPSEHASFICSSIITYLHFEGAGFIDSAPLFGGFVIHSDIDIKPDAVFDRREPYIWDYCSNQQFKYLYGVMQTELLDEKNGCLISRNPLNYSEIQDCRTLKDLFVPSNC